jgi:fatty acid desaturase
MCSKTLNRWNAEKDTPIGFFPNREQAGVSALAAFWWAGRQIPEGTVNLVGAMFRPPTLLFWASMADNWCVVLWPCRIGWGGPVPSILSSLWPITIIWLVSTFLEQIRRSGLQGARNAELGNTRGRRFQKGEKQCTCGMCRCACIQEKEPRHHPALGNTPTPCVEQTS